MEQAKIELLVISVLEELQELSGRKSDGITLMTCPLTDLENFDSLNAVEATIDLEERLGMKLSTHNVFLAEDGKTPLNVSGIASRLAQPKCMDSAHVARK